MSGIYLMILLALLGGMSMNSLAQDCKPIYQLEKHASRTGYINTTGKYCLTHDIIQPRVLDIHAGSYKSFAAEALVIIDYPNEYFDKAIGTWVSNPPLPENSSFEINLQRHLLKGDAENMVGVRASAQTPRVKIQNGVIDVPGIRSPNYGIWFEHVFKVNTKWPRRRDNFGNDRGPGNALETVYLEEDASPTEILKQLSWPIADPSLPLLQYISTNHAVEHMTIHAGWRGIVMGGGGNVLRNSTIEVDGHTAVYMYGPGSIIENNTIIIHGKGDAKPFDAPIKLRDAHGAIVRNNRIVYKRTWLGKEPAAINLLDSTDVRIEGNTVEHFADLVRVNGESSYAEKDTVMK